MRGSRGGDRGPDPPPEKSQSYQASIQCCAIIGLPAKHQQNTIKMVFCWRAIIDNGPSAIWILSSFLPSSKTKKMLSELDPLWQYFLDPRMNTICEYRKVFRSRSDPTKSCNAFHMAGFDSNFCLSFLYENFYFFGTHCSIEH